MRDAAATQSVGSEPVIALSQALLAGGTIVAGRYEIRRILGSGGYAVVYLAHDRQLDREVAFKALRSDRNSSSALTRFRREVNVARQAVSPRLVQIYDIGVDGDLWYLTMEVVPGESLRERMKRAPLTVDEALSVASAILEGLQTLHAVGVIHRDVKPENVLLSDVGDVKVADFGLARFLDDERARLTETEAIVGTTHYISPEQALGHSVDARADLYALGVVLFEMLAARVPFEGQSSFGSVIARLRDPAPSVRRFRSDVPYWLATLIARLLCREPSQRYPAAGAVLEAIRKRHVAWRTMLSRRAVALLLAVAALIATGAILLTRPEQPMRFSRVASAGLLGVAGIGSGGETLWRKSDVVGESRWTLARLEPGRNPVLAMVLMREHDFSPAGRQTLTFLDPDSGATVREIALPSAAGEFPEYSDRYMPQTVQAVDINRDGLDELVVGYNHIPEAPSYLVLYEPRIDRARVIFQGMGGHEFAGVQDVDGDGRAELIIAGINNGVNWYNALAAVRVRPWIGENSASIDRVVRSPDMGNYSALGLAWYVLLPRGLKPERPSGFRWHPEHRQVSLIYGNRPEVVVTFDGFLIGDRSDLPAARRAALRTEAWTHFAKSVQLLAGGFQQEGVEESQAALGYARQAGDAILVEVMECALAKSLIAGGRSEEGEAIFQRLGSSENAAELAYDAGRAYHLGGDLDSALRWYHRGLAAGAPLGVGKSKHEYIQAIVLALGERGEWSHAAEEIERFRLSYVKSAEDWTAAYREFVRWRTGGVPRIDEIEVPPSATDLLRYWMLEFRAARAESPRVLLAAVDKEIGLRAEPLGPLWSLKAALLSVLGRDAEAGEAARRASEIAATAARRNLIARGHLPLIRERLQRYAPEGR